jgi:hypothetical protein
MITSYIDATVEVKAALEEAFHQAMCQPINMAEAEVYFKMLLKRTFLEVTNAHRIFGELLEQDIGLHPEDC